MSEFKEVGEWFEDGDATGDDVIVNVSLDEDEDKVCISLDSKQWALWIPMERIRKLGGKS